MHVTISHRRELARVEGEWIHRASVLERVRDYARYKGFLCTSIARTLVDLSGMLGPEPLEIAFDTAARRVHSMRDDVLSMLKRLRTAGRKGAAALMEIAARDELGPTGSPLEARVRIALRRARIRMPIPQLSIVDDRTGEQIGVFDFAWPEHRVVVCVDSWQHHSTRKIFEKDRRQWAALQAIDWKAIPVTHHRLTHELDAFLYELKAALDR